MQNLIFASRNAYTPRQWTTLAVVIFTLALAMRITCFTGLIASDDLDYARYARQISQSKYRLESYHAAVRYGVFMPVAAVYRLFGIHEWTTVASPIVYSSLAAMLTALIGTQIAGLSVGWTSGLLMATFPVDIRYASILVPEPFLQAIILIGALLFLLAERKDSPYLGFGAGLFLGLSYVTKEPGMLVAGAFVVFALFQRRWRLASWVLAGTAVIVAAEVAWYWSQSGDLLFRLHALAAHNNDRNDIALRMANEHLSWRLWQAYPRMMLAPNVDFGLHSVLALALASAAFVWWSSKNTVWLLLFWAALPFLYLNFGTSSFHFYWALPAAPRYISLVYPPLFILAAATLFVVTSDSLHRRWFARSAVAVTCVVGFFCAVITRGTDYRTEHVRRLKQVVAAARLHNNHICEFATPDGSLWRQVVQIIAPDRIGCTGRTDLELLPDSKGLPSIKYL